MFKVMHRALDNTNKQLKVDNTRVVQKVLSLIGFLSFIPDRRPNVKSGETCSSGFREEDI